MSKKKICTACNEKGMIEEHAPWVKKQGNDDHPPKEFLPCVNDLAPVDIRMGPKYAGKYVYWFASMSRCMLEKRNLDPMNIEPHVAYGDFRNDGICQLDNNGYCRIIISDPVSYYVREENNKAYRPHIHYRLSNKNGKWGKTIYTLKV